MEKKLGLSALTALVLSSMLGAGVFSLPQNMAAVASPAALLIGWGITGAGILLLAFAMLILTRIRPELDGGIFTYAREGFGELIGFCSAWGYWLCAVIANVSYLVIVFSALSFFTDTPELRLFGDGNTWQSIVGASALLWKICLVLIWLTGSDYNTLLTIASEMILVPYFLVGAFLLKIATRPLHKAVGVGACIYGLWLLYASGPMHLLLSVVLYAPGLLVFLYARKTHTHDNVLNRQEMVLIGMLLIASVPATWMLVG